MSSEAVFPQRLVQARRMRGLTQEDLGKRAGLQPAAVSHFETGARKPSFDNLRRLADALNVTADFLLGRSEDPEGFAEADAAFRHGFEQLTEEQRQIAIDFLDVLAKHKTRDE